RRRLSGVGKTKRPSPACQLVEWREALQRDPTIASAVCCQDDRHYTYLHEMADRLYEPVVSLQVAELLLEFGADPNAQTDNGWTPLHFACSTDAREEAMDALLLRSVADPNLTDSRGETPLHYALGASEESRRIVALLLKHGADVDLDAAVRLGDIKRVRRLLRRGGLSQAKNPRNLLTKAIYSGSAAPVALLPGPGVGPNQNPSVSREPPVYTARTALRASVPVL